jgi:hypothetical protein
MSNLPQPLPQPAMAIHYSGLMDPGGYIWNPGDPALDIQGLLLEGNWNSFIALETSQGGPTSVLVQE